MERLEVRIDVRTKRLLEDWAHAKAISISEAVRQIIQQQMGLEAAPGSKQQAAQQLMSIGLVNVPAPDDLEEEIHRAFGA